MICKCFLPSYRLSFHFLDSVLWSQQSLILINFNLSIISFVTCAFGGIYKKSLQILHDKDPLCSH